MQSMKTKVGWLALLALPILHYGRGNAHDLAKQIVVPVKGVDVRAACDDSTEAGNWTFEIIAVSGNISKVDVQMYRNARPTDVDGEWRVCSKVPDPIGRAQDDSCPEIAGNFESAGSIRLQKPQVGNQGALSLPAGIYCVRPWVTGNGSVTVSVLHP